jgi:hypothetical protein
VHIQWNTVVKIAKKKQLNYLLDQERIVMPSTMDEWLMFNQQMVGQSLTRKPRGEASYIAEKEQTPTFKPKWLVIQVLGTSNNRIRQFALQDEISSEAAAVSLFASYVDNADGLVAMGYPLVAHLLMRIEGGENGSCELLKSDVRSSNKEIIKIKSTKEDVNVSTDNSPVEAQASLSGLTFAGSTISIPAGSLLGISPGSFDEYLDQFDTELPPEP